MSDLARPPGYFVRPRSSHPVDTGGGGEDLRLPDPPPGLSSEWNLPTAKRAEPGMTVGGMIMYKVSKCAISMTLLPLVFRESLKKR